MTINADATDPTASKVDRAALPVIDLTDAAGPDHAAHQAVVERLRAACVDNGFFYLIGHGVPHQLTTRVVAAARAFFALDDVTKHAVGSDHVGGLGYRRMGGRALSGAAGAAVKEEYYCARDDVPGEPDHNRWPTGVDGFRPTMEAYLDHLHRLAAQVMSLLAETMELPPDHFAAFCTDPLATLRLVRMPPEGAEAGAHADFGALTFLLQDGQPGLQVFDRPTGGWIHADPIAGSFVVNLGNLFEVLTDGAYPSTQHRVVHPPGVERISVPFFYTGAADHPVECLPAFRAPGSSPRFAATTPARSLTTGHQAQGF